MKLPQILKDFLPFVKYCIVGVLGTTVDAGSLYLFVEYANLPVLPATVLSFLLAVINNFILNKIWTFKNRSTNVRKLFIKFLIISVVGLMITTLSMYIFVYVIGIWYIASKLMTSGIVLTWNFLGNKYWTFRLTDHHVAYEEEHPYELSVVIPAYNEERRLIPTVKAICRHLKKQNYTSEVIVVNDGSIDTTSSVIEKLKTDSDIPMRDIHFKKNRGKGAAVNAGIATAKGRFILFTDADNSTPIEEYDKLRTFLHLDKADVAIGSRYINNSSVEERQSHGRVLMGRIGNFIIQTFLLDGIHDTQCGFKLFTHRAARHIFSHQKVSRWGFDMEALAIARLYNYKIVEVPIRWINSGDSRLRPIRDAFRTFTELIYIKLNMWSGRY